MKVQSFCNHAWIGKTISLPDNLDQSPLPPPSIKFPIKNLFPRPEIQFPFRDRHDHFASHDLPL